MTTVLKVKLTTGEWIIGEVERTIHETNYIRFKNVLVIHVVPHGPQEFRVAMVPFDPTGHDASIDIYHSAIVARPTTVSKEMHDAYVRETTGLEIASTLEGIK